MKKLLLIAVAGIITMSGIAQKKVDELIKFNEAAHSFGKIKQGVPVTYDFTFTNISNEPIVIERAQASCGCTTPKWPQEAIMPGKTGVINVGYNAAAVAPFDKSITVKVAGADDMTTLKISGEVITEAKPIENPQTQPTVIQAPVTDPKPKTVTPATKSKTTKRTTTTSKKS